MLITHQKGEVMSYSRWINSVWYTYWMCQNKETENRQTALFNISGVATFTAQQLRDDIEHCLDVAMKCNLLGRDDDKEELHSYMLEFLADVDKTYPENKNEYTANN